MVVVTGESKECRGQGLKTGLLILLDKYKRRGGGEGEEAEDTFSNGNNILIRWLIRVPFPFLYEISTSNNRNLFFLHRVTIINPQHLPLSFSIHFLCSSTKGRLLEKKSRYYSIITRPNKEDQRLCFMFPCFGDSWQNIHSFPLCVT